MSGQTAVWGIIIFRYNGCHQLSANQLFIFLVFGLYKLSHIFILPSILSLGTTRYIRHCDPRGSKHLGCLFGLAAWYSNYAHLPLTIKCHHPAFQLQTAISPSEIGSGVLEQHLSLLTMLVSPLLAEQEPSWVLLGNILLGGSPLRGWLEHLSNVLPNSKEAEIFSTNSQWWKFTPGDVNSSALLACSAQWSSSGTRKSPWAEKCRSLKEEDSGVRKTAGMCWGCGGISLPKFLRLTSSRNSTTWDKLNRRERCLHYSCLQYWKKRK